jgi:hypothetical protein
MATLPVLSSEPGAWTIPLDSAGIREVEVLWTDVTADLGHSDGEVRLPRSAEPAGPTLVRVSANRTAVALGRTSGFEPISVGWWRIERAERLARRITVLLEDFDRSSAQQGSALSTLLTRFALEARLAERAIRSPETTTGNVSAPSIARAQERLDLSRTAIGEGLGLYGLDEFQSYLGSATEPDAAAPKGSPPSFEGPTLSPLGAATYYRSTSGATESDPAFRWVLHEPATSHDFAIASAVALIVILGVLLPRSLGVGVFQTRAVGVALTMVLLLFTAIAPFAGAIVLLAAWIGRH